MNPSLRGLYAIADTQFLDDAQLVPAVEAAIAGGARVVQYRDKQHPPEIRQRHAKKISDLCRRHGVLFLVNDDAALAMETGADGVHLGREDMGLRAARALIGDNKLIGVSCYNELERALAAERDGADYIAFGSFFPSRTKPGAVHATPELLRAARTQLRIPVVAIGGITPENGATLIEAGADMLAAIDGVFNQTDIRAAAQRYTKLFPKI